MLNIFFVTIIVLCVSSIWLPAIQVRLHSPDRALLCCYYSTSHGPPTAPNPPCSVQCVDKIVVSPLPYHYLLATAATRAAAADNTIPSSQRQAGSRRGTYARIRAPPIRARCSTTSCTFASTYRFRARN